jgi:hypothetical protein
VGLIDVASTIPIKVSLALVCFGNDREIFIYWNLSDDFAPVFDEIELV